MELKDIQYNKLDTECYQVNVITIRQIKVVLCGMKNEKSLHWIRQERIKRHIDILGYIVPQKWGKKS